MAEEEEQELMNGWAAWIMADSSGLSDDSDDDDGGGGGGVDDNSASSLSLQAYYSSSSSEEEDEEEEEEEENEFDDTDSFSFSSSESHFSMSTADADGDDNNDYSSSVPQDDDLSTMSAMAVLVGRDRASTRTTTTTTTTHNPHHFPNNMRNMKSVVVQQPNRSAFLLGPGSTQRRHRHYNEDVSILPALNIIHHDDILLFQDGRVVKRRKTSTWGKEVKEEEEEQSSFLPAVAATKVIPSSSIKDDDSKTTTRSNNILCFQDLPLLMQLSIFQFLDLKSLIAVRQVDRSRRDLLRSVHSETRALIWKPACQRQWPWLNDIAEKELLAKTNDDGAEDFARILSLAAKGIPSHSVDEASFPRLVQFTTDSTTTGTAIEYTGVIGPGNRCIRANTPLPRPSTKIMGRPLNSTYHSPFFQWEPYVELWKPFVVPFAHQTGNNYCFKPRLVSYFEVTILPPRNSNDDRNNNRNNNRRDCVAIGLAESMGLAYLSHRMPGWDANSFGYHGDDGGYFHGGGWSVEHFPVFGDGDCVGCGIDYCEESLFFCKNGEFLGYLHHLSERQLSQDWYPVVGLDSRCPVQVNFGLTPFQFDLEEFIKEQSETVATALRR